MVTSPSLLVNTSGYQLFRIVRFTSNTHFFMDDSMHRLERVLLESGLYEPLEVISPFPFSPRWSCGRRPSDQETSPRRCPGRKTLPLVGGREGG